MQTLRLFNERISLRYSTRMLLTTMALVGLLFCLFIASLLIGEYSLSIGTVINTLFQQYAGLCQMKKKSHQFFSIHVNIYSI